MKYFTLTLSVLLLAGCSDTHSASESKPVEPKRFTVETFEANRDCNVSIFTDNKTGQQYITKSNTSNCPLTSIPAKP